MAQSVILDQNGKPFEKSSLGEEIARPSIFGIRQIWKDAVSAGLTPAGLSEIIRDAINGNHDAYLQLAEEMEEKDLHYRAVLSNRKNALKGLTPTVMPFSDSKEDLQIAQDVETMMKSRMMKAAIPDIMDALGKGFSVNEIVWDTTQPLWTPAAYKYRHPYHFTFDEDTQSEVRIKTDANPTNGDPLAFGKFITHIPILKSGIPIRGGIAMVAAWGFLFKAFSAKDWIAFAEVFGMPIRVGKYGHNANEGEIKTLIRAIQNIGTDAGAVIPENMSIEFEDAVSGAGGDKLYERICNYWDGQISKVVLGQTMTTDDGSSNSQATVHDEIRLDIKEADAADVVPTLQRDVIEPYMLFNYGGGAVERAPTLGLPVPRPKDVKLIVESVTKLLPHGLRVGQRQMQEIVGLDEPDPDDTLLTAGAADEIPSDSTETGAAPNARRKANARTVADEQFDSFEETLLLEAMDEWEEMRDPILNPILKAIHNARTIEDMDRLLAKSITSADSAELVRRLGEVLFNAREDGRIE